MKKYVSLVLVIATVLMMVGASPSSASAEESESNRSNVPENVGYCCYEIPDRSGYQLTQEQLSAPTAQLIEYILDYPYIVDLFVSSSPSDNAYSRLCDSFNGLAELELRCDAASEMLQMLVTESASDIKAPYLKALLAVPSCFAKLTEQEISLYSSYKATAAQARAAVAFTLNGFDYTRADINAYTTGGTVVPLYTAMSDYSETEKSTIAQNTATAYGITKLGNATSKYNCHSYAWYNTSTSNTYVIEKVGAYIYVCDDHSTYLTNASVGAIAVYLDSYDVPLHSAIVTSVNGTNVTCKSKWGANGLFEHSLANVPVDYTFDGRHIKVVYCKYTKSHSCTIKIDNAATHTKTCTVCGWTSTEAHVEHVPTGKCVTCGLQGPFLAYMSTTIGLGTDERLYKDG